MVNWDSQRLEDLLKLAIGLVLVVLVNLLASKSFFRVDLTEEKRFSIKEATKDLLKNLDEDVYVEVYLAGELNADFQRLQNGIKEVLEEFKIYSNNKVKYAFQDPTISEDAKTRNEFIADLSAKGITPTQVYDNKDGVRTQKLILPGAIVSFGAAEKGVTFLKGSQSVSAIEKINQSIEGVEYELAIAIAQLSGAERKKIGLLKGHGELEGLQISGLKSLLSQNYVVETVKMADSLSPEIFDALIIAKPSQRFSEIDKFLLDQYIMKGGKVLFFIDKLEVDMSKIDTDANYAFPYDIGLDDMLFKYGIRVNDDLVQDMMAATYPIVVGSMGDQPQIQMIPWPFYPLVNNYASHNAVKNLDAITTKFVSTIDTTKAIGVSKTPIMFTSGYSRSINAPVKVALNDLRKDINPNNLDQSNMPVGYLLEGEFTSLFKNRFLPEGIEGKFIEQSAPTKIVVIADGDIVKSEVNSKSGEAYPLGYDPYARTEFANKDLITNLVNYMVDENGIISARAKEIKIRPLDKIKIKEDSTYWQVINLVIPLVLLVLFGILKYMLRKRKYARF